MRARPFGFLFGLSLTLVAAPLMGCGDDDGMPADSGMGGSDAGPPLEPTYANVAAVIGRSCTFTTSCHGGSRGQASLLFMGVDDLTTELNGVPSCQYDAMPRVDPGNPDNSWMMVKIDGMRDASNMVVFTPDPGWTPDTSDPLCPGDGNFGLGMPFGAPPLPDNEIEMIRQWIANGATGP